MKRGTAVLLAACLSGCAAHPSVSNYNPSPSTFHAKAGQTLKQAVDRLPSTGGIVLLGAGTWISGYQPGDPISKPNVTIQGAGMPDFNSDFSAMTGGTIILGPVYVTSGADGFTARYLGVDVGPAYVKRHGGSAADGLAIFNAGQVLGARPVQSPTIEYVSCLGSSPSAQVHCMLVENVNNAFVHNVQTVMNCHGLVLKGTNSRVDGVYSRGHAIDSVIVKSNVYAPASHDILSKITITPLVSPGDTKGIIVIADGAPASNISISNVQVRSPLWWGMYVQGVAPGASVNALSLSDITIDYPGGSPVGHECMQFVQYVSDVTVQNLNCTHMWAGIVPFLPDTSTFGQFTVQNSNFSNIEADAISTFSSWMIKGSNFTSIGGNGIVNPYGVTTVSDNVFVDITGSNMLSTGGSFVTETP